MAIKTTQEQLEEVQAAIEQVLASQEMGWGPDRVKRPDLDTLYKQEERLLKRLAAEQGQGFAINTGLAKGWS
jgi:hypothetical protein